MGIIRTEGFGDDIKELAVIRLAMVGTPLNEAEQVVALMRESQAKVLAETLKNEGDAKLKKTPTSLL